MGKNDRNGAVFDGLGERFAGVDRGLVDKARGQFMDPNHAIDRIERHNHQVLLRFVFQERKPAQEVFGRLDWVRFIAQNVAARKFQAGQPR